MSHALVVALALKVDQDAELIEKMLDMIPADKAAWLPDWPAHENALPFTTTRLAAHMVESFAGLCACFHRLHPQTLAHFDALKEQLTGAPDFTLAQSIHMVAVCRSHMAEGFSYTSDKQLGQLIPTYFSPQGETFLAVLLENWKHINHHAHQLFLYLKLMGQPVSTKNLYHFKSLPD